MDKISIIVPVYNVKKYLEECVLSILNQTFINIEILLIDDGSTDDSGELCDCLARKDSRIIVIHQCNGGVSVARNRGIEHATGEYICFVDADDTIAENYVEILYQLLKSNQADLAMFVSINNTQKESTYNTDSIQIMNGTTALNKLVYQGYSWNKMFVNNVLQSNKIRFPVGVKIFEDFNFCFFYLLHVNKVVYLPCDLYNYRVRPDSAVASKGIEREKSKLKAIKKMLEVKDPRIGIDMRRELENVYSSAALHIVSKYVLVDKYYNKEKKKFYLRKASIYFSTLNKRDKFLYYFCKFCPSFLYRYFKRVVTMKKNISRLTKFFSEASSL